MKKILFVVAVAAVAFSFASAHAQSPVRAVGFQAGLVNPDNMDATWEAGAFVDFGLPLLNVSVGPFVDWWSQDVQEGASKVTFSDTAIGAKVKYFLPTPVVRPFFGVGVAAHMLKSDVTFSDPLFGAFSGSASDTKLGWHVGGGAEVGVGKPFNVFAEGWWGTVDNFNQVSVRGGLAFTM